jgi:hypothetical protein
MPVFDGLHPLPGSRCRWGRSGASLDPAGAAAPATSSQGSARRPQHESRASAAYSRASARTDGAGGAGDQDGFHRDSSKGWSVVSGRRLFSTASAMPSRL